MSNPIRAMKRIGTSGNYLRITEANEHLLNDNKMIEVFCVETDKGLQEEGSSAQDFLASKDLARIVGEILTLDQKRASLVAHAAGLIGGPKALKNSGIEVPEQTMHDTPAKRTQRNQDKQSQKSKDQKAKARDARKKRREEIKEVEDRQKADKDAIAEGGAVTGVQMLPPIVRDDAEQVAPVQPVELPEPESDEDI